MKYSIGEVAKTLDLTIYTLRYYDKDGLMPFVERTPSVQI
ncbi:MerR family DNA-binding transcriptional regulator [Methanosarcina siciliae]